MNEKILPLGTVVNLKNGDGTQLMIISRASLTINENKKVFYDYGSVIMPQGMSTPENIYFFNKESINEVVFMGYIDSDEQLFSESYEDMIQNSKYPKGKTL